MPTLDPRIYVDLATAPAFALPLLTRLREDVHAACPDVVETIKWSRPHFLLDDKLLCGMSAFKAHCAFRFWQREGVGEGQGGAMGDFGRITSLTDLSSRIERRQQIQAAAALLRAGAPRALKPNRTPRPTLAMPDDFAAALAQVKAAQQTYDAFPPGQQRDYLAWVLEARREDTRAKRIAQAAGWSSAAWTGGVGIRRRRLPGRGQARRGHGADLVRRHAAGQAPGTGADEEVGTAAGGGRTAEAAMRAKVEHPLRVVKNLFGHRKARYRGMAKNQGQRFSLFGLANLVIAKRSLLDLQQQTASKAQTQPLTGIDFKSRRCGPCPGRSLIAPRAC